MDATETLESGPRGGKQARPGLVIVWPTRRVVHVPPKGVVLGRSSESDVVLDDGKVSRRHLALRPERGGLYAEDLKSHNGSRVGGLDVVSVRMEPGAVVRIGETIGVVVRDALPHEAPPITVPPLVGGASLDAVRRDIRAAARSNASVLVLGESGTGKERVARAIAERSDRDGRFVAVNCGALAPNLVESELFGHVRGAFSGADRGREGLFRSAHGGTLLLDELGELPLSTQVKLLRVLEEGTVRPVGSDEEIAVDVRVLGATHRDLEDEVGAGRFRRDLYHRLASIRIELPALRVRREDVTLLVEHLLEDGGPQPDADAIEALLLHDWPGNVRELAQVLRAALARLGVTGDAALGGALFGDLRALPSGKEATEAQQSEESPRDLLVRALGAAGGNVAEVARRLAMRRATVYEQMKRFGIDASEFRS